jgi:C-terminal processing protease CtpA/Prc
MGENWTVAGVIADSQAAITGVREGDRLLELNGNPIQSVKREEFEAIFNRESGTRIRLRFKSNGESPRDVILVLP